jgi:hypothetical protein
MRRSLWIVAAISLLASTVYPTQAIAALCTTSSTVDGGYKYILFTSSTACDWAIPTGVRKIDYLAVAGGGGGVTRHGGGGGAGGLLQANNVSVSWGSVLSITVGAGGSIGTNGSDSVISGGGLGTITALKGGTGGAAASSGTVGSGGGAQGTGSIGYGTSGQGKNGGLGSSGWGCAGTTSGWCGGGGGGYSADGEAAFASRAGNGGNGTTVGIVNVTVATALAIGEIRSTSVYFAGGGGGGADYGGVEGSGGYGGGGAGSVGLGTATAGSARTGGGGGGGGYHNSAGNGVAAAGGSGVVLIRYFNDITAPSFNSSSTPSVAENTAIASNAISISVSESATITMSSGVDTGDFTIVRTDTNTAALRFTVSPNFESPLDQDTNGTFLVVLTATDEYTNASTQSLTITLTNVNEAPVITTNSGASSWSGNRAENTALVFDFDATDVDAATTLTWTVSGTDAGDFSIGSSTGVLNFASGPDFEEKLDQDSNNIYLVTVNVSDGALTASQSLTITVTNLNESISPDAPTLSATPFKGISVTITVKTYTSGKVRFLVGGKRIPNCLNVSTVGSYPNAYATCSWKPASASRLTLGATFIPSDNTFSNSTSSNAMFWVTKRTGTR